MVIRQVEKALIERALGRCNGVKIKAADFLGINRNTLRKRIKELGASLPGKPGEIGEMVITTLTKEAFPMIRYRTRDLTRLITEPCACGSSNTM